MKTLLTLTGPSCAGKTTLETELKKVGFENAISTTTRPMREGEVNGKSYYFVNADTFIERLNENQFIENVSFNGHNYGVEEQELERVFSMGKPVVLIVEPNGLRQIRSWAAYKRDVKLFSIFIDSPASVISDRFLQRYTADFALSIAKGSKEMDRVIDTYKKRLGVMMEEERYWASQCSPLVDLNLECFNEANQQMTLKLIRRMALNEFDGVTV